MIWITRERPKIDRIACPWLIRRFIDRDADIMFVPAEAVIQTAERLNAIPFDIPGVEYTHYEDQCTFDYFLKKHRLDDEALHVLAPIVRGADTDDHSLARESAGLWAVSAGLAFNVQDDKELLDYGMLIYDALYSWAKHLRETRHTQSPVEKILLEVLHTYQKETASARKIPEWVEELKNRIQDQIDTNLMLTELSRSLDVNPAYVSRVFGRYFDNLSYGEYIRKLRIERAIELLTTTRYSLSEIAYLTGFSDQSHFTRIFKMVMQINPSEYRKNIGKGKTDTKR